MGRLPAMEETVVAVDEASEEELVVAAVPVDSVPGTVKPLLAAPAPPPPKDPLRVAITCCSCSCNPGGMVLFRSASGEVPVTEERVASL